jgi:hypothetical protein
MRPCSPHHHWHIEQMIEMSVSHQDRVDLRREMPHAIRHARNVRLNARTKRNAQKVYARKIRIDDQCMTLEFELVSICAEISHAHSVARSCRRIANNQISIRAESRAKGLGRESDEKKERAFQVFGCRGKRRFWGVQ